MLNLNSCSWSIQCTTNTHTHTHIDAHTNTPTHTHTHMHSHTHAHMHTPAQTYTYTQMDTHAHTHIHPHAHTHAHMHIHYTCTHTHTLQKCWREKREENFNMVKMDPCFYDILFQNKVLPYNLFLLHSTQKYLYHMERNLLSMRAKLQSILRALQLLNESSVS